MDQVEAVLALVFDRDARASGEELSDPEQPAMSIKHVSAVLKHYGGKPHLKLLLVVLANHANEATGECWPSYATIAAQCNTSRSAAMRNVKTLISEGVLEIVELGGIRENPFGKLVQRANAYRVRLDRLLAMADFRKRVHQRKQMQERERDTTCNGGGAVGDTTPVAPVIPGDGGTRETPTVLECESLDEASSQLSLRAREISQLPEARRAVQASIKRLAKRPAGADDSELTAARSKLTATYGAKIVRAALQGATSYAQRRGEPLTARTLEFFVKERTEAKELK